MTTLAASGRLCGGHCWVERRLFEVLGGWVATTPPPVAKLALDRHSQHHAWRAAQWWDRLPVVASVDRDALVVPPSPGWGALVGELFALGDPVERLAGAYRVALPRLVAAYRTHAGRVVAVSDASVGRTLGHVAADLAADWADGEAVLQELVADPAGVDRAAAVVARLEGLLVSGGG